MPIQSNGDYIPAMDDFIAHWTTTDTALTISDGSTLHNLAAFQQLRQDLDSAQATFQAILNDLENSRVILDNTRKNAGDRIAEFNRRIRADHPNNQLFNRLPAVPNRTAGREAFLSALDDTLNLWGKVNTQPISPLFPGQLLLLAAFSWADCTTLRAEVDAAFTARATAENATTAARLQRKTLQEKALFLIKQYRLKIEAIYPADSIPVLSLPRLTPAPGHTPDPVPLSGTWDPDHTRATLTWQASADPELDHYQLRAVPGPDYSSEDESVLANIPPGGPLQYHSSTGYSLPGMAVSYKLYVILTTGNQAGSDPITIERPA